MKTLETVLKIIANTGLKLKLKKCMFIQPEATYVGYQVNKDGVCQLPEKFDFIQNNSPPQNVSELNSFLRLINYYYRHLPSFSKKNLFSFLSTFFFLRKN